MKGDRDILSWCAGLFDADGCLCLYWENNPASKQFPYLRATATLDIRDEVAVDIFLKLFGGSKRKKTRKNEKHSQTFVWRATGENLDNFLRKIGSLLVLKSPHADLVVRARGVRKGRASTPITNEEHNKLKEFTALMSKLNETGVGKSWQPVRLYVDSENMEG